MRTENNKYTCYHVGMTGLSYDPAQKEIRDMLYLVAYDVCSPKRLRLVARTCEDYGVRVEYSVFECDLSPDLFQSLWKELTAIISEKEDSLLAYRICAGCVAETHSSGAVVRPVKFMIYML